MHILLNVPADIFVVVFVESLLSQAGIIFIIVIAVVFGRIYAKRKQQRNLQRRVDLERQEQVSLSAFLNFPGSI
jgi:hypothetical protein